MLESRETDMPFNVKEKLTAPENVVCLMDGESTCGTALFEEHTFREGPEIIGHTKHGKQPTPPFSIDLMAVSLIQILENET